MTGTLKYGWEIEKFSSLNKEAGGARRTVSPTFYVGVQDKFHTEWQMELYPGGISKEYCEYVGLYLTLLHSNYTVVGAKFKFWFSKKSGDPLYDKLASYNFQLLHGINGHRSGWYNMASRASLERELLHNDKLTIHCSIEISELSGIHLEHMVPSSFNSPTSNLQWRLYTEKRLTDMTIKVGEEEFQVHKAIMAAHSAVFAAMFELDMAEKANSTVTVTDYDASVVENFIKSIYAQNVEVTARNAAELLSIAEKYDAKALKTKCEIVLSQDLSKGTAAAALLIADTHNASVLLEATLDYIARKETRKVMEAEEWQSVIARPSLAHAVVNRLVDSLEQFKK